MGPMQDANEDHQACGKQSPLLYGRARHVAFLRNLYDSIVGKRCDEAVDRLGRSPNKLSVSSELVILSGERGVGKRTLARSLQSHVLATGGLFVESQNCSNVDHASGNSNSERPLAAADYVHLPNTRPFGVWRQALDGIFQRDIAVSQEVNSNRVCSLRQALELEFSTAKDRNAAELLLDMIDSARDWCIRNSCFKSITAVPTSSHTANVFSPSLNLCQPSNMSTATEEWSGVLQRLIRAVVSCRPLVVVLNGLELADSASMDLLQTLLGQSRLARGCSSTESGLMIVVTCRDVNKLPDWLAETHGIHHCGDAIIQRVRLNKLSWADLYNWTASSYGRKMCPDDTIQSITDFVFETSQGNPQLATYVYCYLASLMARKAQKSTEILITSKSLDAIRRDVANCDASSLFLLTIATQSARVQKVIKLVAALNECCCYQRGDDKKWINRHTLEMVLQCPCVDELLVAHEYKLLFVALGDNDCDIIKFPSPELQAIAYRSMVPTFIRAAFHLKIGRRLWKHSAMRLSAAENPCEQTAFIFVVSRNLRLGIDQVKEARELRIVVSICLHAGKLAMKSSNFSVAANHFEFAIGVLTRHRLLWQSGWYDVSLVLSNCACEAYYCIADFDNVVRTADDVLHHTKSFPDQLQAYTTLVYANGARNRLNEAMSIAFDVLERLGEPFPLNPDKCAVRIQYLKTRMMVWRKSDRFFLRLPRATNAEKIAAMHVLNFTIVYSYLLKPAWGLLAIFRVMQLACRYGMTESAIPSFAAFGFVLCVHLNRLEEGGRFGRIALALLDQSGAHAWLPRIHWYVHGLVFRWVYPMRESLEPLRSATRVALKTGDMEGSVFNAYSYLNLAFHVGQPLQQVEKEARSRCFVMDSLHQEQGLLYIVPVWSCASRLMGKSWPSLSLTGGIANADDVYLSAKGNSCAVRVASLFQTVYFCLTRQYQQSLQSAAMAWEAQSDANLWLTFYEGLSSLAEARKGNGNQMIGRKAIKRLKHWSRVCRSNCQNKQALLEAELAALQGKTSKAMYLFNLSIEAAAGQGFVQEEGLAYDRLGQYHSFLGNPLTAVPFLEKARCAYARWGALTLVDQMDEVIHET